MQMYETSRKKPRFDVNLESHYRSDTEWEPCTVFDINLEGAGLNTECHIEKEEIIEVRLKTPMEETIVNGEVVYSKNNRAGVIFNNISASDLVVIKKIINKYSDRFKI